MKLPHRIMIPALGSLMAGLLFGCSGINDGTQLQVAANASLITGVAMKGPIESGNVQIFRVNGDGSRGQIVGGPFVTQARPDAGQSVTLDTVPGSWSGSVPFSEAGPFILQVSRGSYTDEGTGTTVNMNQILNGFWDPTSLRGGAAITISPFTEMLYQAALQIIADGVKPASALEQVISDGERAFLFDFTRVIPPDPLDISATLQTNGEQQTYAAYLAGISRLANTSRLINLPGTPLDKVKALVLDMSDGRLDGKTTDGTDVLLPTQNPKQDPPPVTLPALDPFGITPLRDEAKAFKLSSGLDRAVIRDIPLVFGSGGGVGESGSAFAVNVDLGATQPVFSWDQEGLGKASSLTVTKLSLLGSNTSSSDPNTTAAVWSISGTFGSPVTYFTAPAGASVNSSGGQEPQLESGQQYRVSIVINIQLIERTEVRTGFLTFTAP